MSADPYRYCVYCQADCYADEPEHGPECPSSTGIYVVEVHPHCGTCSCDHAILCSECDVVLNVGDSYMHRTIEQGDPLLPGLEGADVREPICVGCAAKEAFSAQS